MSEERTSLAPNLGNWTVLRNVLDAATIACTAEASGGLLMLVNDELGYQLSVVADDLGSLTIMVQRLDGKPFYSPATKYPGPSGITPMLSSWQEIPLALAPTKDIGPIPIRRNKK